jgi:hypothetical protein
VRKFKRFLWDFLFTGAGKGTQIPFPPTINYGCPTSDKRIKSYFTIVNDSVEPNVELPVVALSDGGNTGELTLPAKKIVQLGLKPKAGKAGKFGVKGTISGASTTKLLFVPHVVVAFHFRREKSTDIETRECPAFATCQESEYEDYVRNKATVEDFSVSSTGPVVTAPVSPLPDVLLGKADVSSEFPPPTTAIAKVPLSPAYHRPTNCPDQQVALGHEVLSKLAVHADFEHSVLWVEEEVGELNA